MLGIDPGVSGGFAVVRYRDLRSGNHAVDLLAVGRFPTLEVKVGRTKRTRLDVVALADVIYKLSDQFAFDAVAIEEVHAMPAQGVVSTFTFGRALGIVEGITAGLAQHIYVPPQRWQPLTGATSDKRASLGLCVKFFGEHWAPDFKTLADSGKADAALIALCVAKNLKVLRAVSK